MNRSRAVRWIGASIAVAACGDPTTVCEEDIRAAVFEETREVTLGGETREVAYADATLAARGLRHRLCEIPTLAFPYPEAGVWTCGVTTDLDVIVASDAEVLAVFTSLPPCDDPDCGSCPIYGAGLEGAAWVVEWPSGVWSAEDGAPFAITAP